MAIFVQKKKERKKERKKKKEEMHNFLESYLIKAHITSGTVSKLRNPGESANRSDRYYGRYFSISNQIVC